MPNHILPELLVRDAVVCAMTRDAQFMLFKISVMCDDHHRLAVGTSPQRPDVLRATLYPCNPEIRIPTVIAWLEENQAAGTVLIADSERGWYVEVAERFRYRREDYKEGQPKYGPRIPMPPQQAELPYGLPGVKAPRGRPKKIAATQVNQSRVEGEDIAESARAREGDSGTRRAVARGESPEKFARGEDFVDDPLWGDVLRAIGLQESTENGALWAARLREHRLALAMAYAQLRDAGDAVQNKAAWLTTAFERIKREQAASGTPQ